MAQLDTATNESRELPELIFTNSQGSHIRPDNLQKRFASACKEAGIEPHENGKAWSVHELRHTAASQLQMSNVRFDASFSMVRDESPPGKTVVSSSIGVCSSHTEALVGMDIQHL